MKSNVLRSDGPIASVVIPAHNEAAVIGRLLSALPREIDNRRLEIVVACNGCTDDTAAIARNLGANVVEVAESSKIAALNAGDSSASAFPRIFIDADVVVDERTIRDLIAALKLPGVFCASAPFEVTTAGRPWVIRAYFSMWLRIPYLRDAYVGSGMYALSQDGRGRFSKFPSIIADDLFIRNLFFRHERQLVATRPFTIEAPWTLMSLLRRRVRINIGNLELRSDQELSQLPGGNEPSRPWWTATASNPLLVLSAIVYGSINAIASVMAHRNFRRKAPVPWARDNTTR